MGHVKVPSRSRTEALVAEGLDIQSLATRLGVDYVLEGAVQQIEDHIHITLQMVRVADGYQVFSRTYERSLADGFRTQDEIAANVAQKSHDKIWEDLRRQFPERFRELRGVNPRAVRLYLDSAAQYNDWLMGDGGDLQISLQLAEMAAEADPNFTLAQTEIAWNLLRRIYPGVTASEASVRAHRAVDGILARQPRNIDALMMKVQIYIQLDLDYASAEMLYHEVMGFAPRASWWRAFMSNISFREGRYPEGLRFLEMEVANGLRNTRTEFLPVYAAVLKNAGLYSRSLETAETALEMIHGGPQRAQVLLSKAESLLALERTEEGRAVLESAWELGKVELPEFFAAVFVRVGEPERAREALARASVSSVNRGQFCVRLSGVGGKREDVQHDPRGYRGP